MGFSSDSSNGGGNGRDDGSLAVAQIRAPSTPFSSDTDPFSDFHASSREDVVTVKDVEEIVEAVRSSFARFIETQRSYLDQQSRSSTDTDTSKNESTAESKQQSSQPSSTVEKGDEEGSSPTGLTEAAVSDIIEAVDERSDFLNTEIQGSISDLKDGITSKLDSINNEISEKLIDSSSADEDSERSKTQVSNSIEDDNTTSSNDMLMSFVEFMTESEGRTGENLDSLNEYVDSMVERQGRLEETISTLNIDSSIGKAQTEISTESIDADIWENKGILGHDNETENASQDYGNANIANEIDGYIENVTDAIGKISFSETSSAEDGGETPPSSYNPSSMVDIVNENNTLLKALKIDIDGLAEQMAGISSDGIAGSMVEMMVQNSMMQMLASNTVEGMSSMMMKEVDDKFGDVIRAMREMSGSQSSIDSGRNISSTLNSSIEDSSNSEDANSASSNMGISGEEYDLESGQPSSISNFEGLNGEASEESTSVANTESEKKGLLDFIGDAFSGLMSKFRIGGGEESESVNVETVGTFEEPNPVEPMVQPIELFPSMENDEGESGQDILPSETHVERENAPSNGGASSTVGDDSIETAIQRARIDNANSLKALDSSVMYAEEILDRFDSEVNLLKDKWEGSEEEAAIGGSATADLLERYMSVGEERYSYASNMADMQTEGMREMETAVSETTVSNMEHGSGGVSESTEGTTELLKAIEDSREYNGRRFDTIEAMLTSEEHGEVVAPYEKPSDMPFKVDRIG